jgi:hypothetical protein
MTEAGFNLRNIVLNKTRMVGNVQKHNSCSEVGTGLVEVIQCVCVCVCVCVCEREREREREREIHILHIIDCIECQITSSYYILP